MNNRILVLLTGGTIDGVINPGDGKKLSGESAVKAYLDTMDLYFDIEFIQICNKDSREINNEDRKKILNAAIKNSAEKILILHGTHTMVDTAKYLEKNIDQITNKTITLTGSMIPLKEWYPGDAPFNLGFAISSLIYSDKGVFVAMNGRLFKPNETKKNIEKLRFDEI